MMPFPYAFAAKIAVILLLIASAYVKGCSDEKERFDEFKITVEAVGRAQEARTKERIAADKVAKLETDRAWVARVGALSADLDVALGRLRKQRPGSSIVPAAPSPAASGGAAEANSGVVCYSREGLRQGLDASMGRFAERYAASVQRGANAIVNFEACATWALGLHP